MMYMPLSSLSLPRPPVIASVGVSRFSIVPVAVAVPSLRA